MQVDHDLFQQISGLRLAAPGLATGPRQGDRRSPFLGRGMEFADYREYRPGDDLRLVDWNVYGRLQAVLVRLFHEDRNLLVRLVVDATGSMGFGSPRKLDHAGNLAAGLALVGLMHRDTVSLGCFGGQGPEAVVTGHDLGAFASMLELLERVEPGAGGEARRALRSQVASRGGDRVVLLSDLLMDDEEREGLLGVLAACRRPVLLHVLGDTELQPDLDRPRLVVDVETGEELAVPGGASARQAYARFLEAWLHDLRVRCAALRIHYVPAFTATSPRDLLLTVLRKARVTEGSRA